MMLETIKTALRISHTKLDNEINNTIAVARAELIRAGVLIEKANAVDDELINEAIKVYCLYTYSNNEKMAEGYSKSWQYQVDNLRKSKGYRAGDTNV